MTDPERVALDYIDDVLTLTVGDTSAAVDESECLGLANDLDGLKRVDWGRIGITMIPVTICDVSFVLDVDEIAWVARGMRDVGNDWGSPDGADEAVTAACVNYPPFADFEWVLVPVWDEAPS